MNNIRYFQPNMSEIIDKNGDYYDSWQVWLDKENVIELFPNTEIFELHNDDVEQFYITDIQTLEINNLELLRTLIEYADVASYNTENYLDEYEEEIYSKHLTAIYTKKHLMEHLEDIKNNLDPIQHSILLDVIANFAKNKISSQSDYFKISFEFLDI